MFSTINNNKHKNISTLDMIHVKKRHNIDYGTLELQCGFSLYGSCLSGDVHWGGNLEKVGDNIYAKRDAIFSYWIALSSCCARLAPIFDLSEVELQCGFSLFGSRLSGDVYSGGNLEKVGKNIYAKRDARFSQWIARHLCCTCLAPISAVPEVELQCGFSLFGSRLSGDVHWGGNLEKVGDDIYAKRDASFPRIALRISCTRLAPISDIPEVELQCGFSLYGSCFSGDVHWGGKLEKEVGENIYAKRDARFSQWIARHLCCTRLAPISAIPEMELQCGFSLYGSCLSGDVHWVGNLEKVGDDIYAKRDAIFSQDCTSH